jgi:acyl-CoA thioesterase YciA
MKKNIPSIRVVMMPKDTNAMGNIFGGTILSYIDIAGAQECRKHGLHDYVTVAMEEVEFKLPVYVGDTVSFYTSTERLGRTSVTVRVQVKSIERLKSAEDERDVTEALVTYVAVDKNRRPIPVETKSF